MFKENDLVRWVLASVDAAEALPFSSDVFAMFTFFSDSPILSSHCLFFKNCVPYFLFFFYFLSVCLVGWPCPFSVSNTAFFDFIVPFLFRLNAVWSQFHCALPEQQNVHTRSALHGFSCRFHVPLSGHRWRVHNDRRTPVILSPPPQPPTEQRFKPTPFA